MTLPVSFTINGGPWEGVYADRKDYGPDLLGYLGPAPNVKFRHGEGFASREYELPRLHITLERNRPPGFNPHISVEARGGKNIHFYNTGWDEQALDTELRSLKAALDAVYPGAARAVLDAVRQQIQTGVTPAFAPQPKPATAEKEKQKQDYDTAFPAWPPPTEGKKQTGRPQAQPASVVPETATPSVTPQPPVQEPVSPVSTSVTQDTLAASAESVGPPPGFEHVQPDDLDGPPPGFEHVQPGTYPPADVQQQGAQYDYGSQPAAQYDYGSQPAVNTWDAYSYGYSDANYPLTPPTEDANAAASPGPIEAPGDRSVNTWDQYTYGQGADPLGMQAWAQEVQQQRPAAVAVENGDHYDLEVGGRTLTVDRSTLDAAVAGTLTELPASDTWIDVYVGEHTVTLPDTLFVEPQ